MTESGKPITEAEARLKAAQMAEIAANAWAEYANSLSRGETTTPPAVVPTAVKSSEQETLDEKLLRLPLSDACIEFLNTRRKSQNAKQIWAALETAGRTSEATDPVKSVTWALKKLLGNGHEDLFSPGFGQWHLKSKYSKKRLNKILTSTAGRGGRPSSEHSEKTKAGIERRRAEGKRVGAPRRYTVEHIRAWRQYIDEGKLVKDACELAGLAYATYNQNHKAVKAWREGDPWPLPEERLKELEAPHVRLISSKE